MIQEMSKGAVWSAHRGKLDDFTIDCRQKYNRTPISDPVRAIS